MSEILLDQNTFNFW